MVLYKFTSNKYHTKLDYTLRVHVEAYFLRKAKNKEKFKSTELANGNSISMRKNTFLIAMKDDFLNGCVRACL